MASTRAAHDNGLPPTLTFATCKSHVAAERSRFAQRLAEHGCIARVQGLDRSVDVVPYPIEGKPLILSRTLEQRPPHHYPLIM